MLQGQPVELPEGEISLGRSRSCTVPLKDPSVSRSHALLMVRGGEVSLRDLNSSNGTFVNGARLAAEVAVRDGDRVLFGETEAIVRIVPPPDHPSATLRVDLDSLFCPSCKAPLPEHFKVCANCGWSRDSSPGLEQPTVPVAAVPSFSGSGSRQVIAPAPSVAPVVGPPPAARPGAVAPAPAPRAVGPAKLALSEPSSRAPVPRPQGGTLEPAGFWIRLAAWLLDTLWMTLLAVGASFAVGGPTSQIGQWLSPALFLGLDLLVPVLGWGLFGTTPGKRLLGLFVGPVAGGVGIGIGKALLRWIGTLLSMVLLGLGFVLIGISKDKRGLHDQIAGTVVGRKR